MNILARLLHIDILPRFGSLIPSPLCQTFFPTITIHTKYHPWTSPMLDHYQVPILGHIDSSLTKILFLHSLILCTENLIEDEHPYLSCT